MSNGDSAFPLQLLTDGLKSPLERELILLETLSAGPRPTQRSLRQRIDNINNNLQDYLPTITGGMATSSRCLGNMLMHLNCLNLRLAGYNTRPKCSLGTSSR